MCVCVYIYIHVCVCFSGEHSSFAFFPLFLRVAPYQNHFDGLLAMPFGLCWSDKYRLIGLYGLFILCSGSSLRGLFSIWPFGLS